MKYVLYLPIVLAIISCHRQSAPWPYEGDKQTVFIETSAAQGNGFNALPASCQLFIYDESNQRTERQDAQQEGSKNLYRIELFPGTYTGYCVTNAGEASYWKYEEDSTPEEIFLKSQAQGGSRDHLIGRGEIRVEAEGENRVHFQLERKVGQVLVVVHNVPEWLTDLQLKISGIPQGVSLTGEYDSHRHTVTTHASQAIGGVSVTPLLVFPPQGSSKGRLTLLSEEHKYISKEYEIQQIEANKITRIDITFERAPEMNIVEFSTTLVEWDKDTIHENWETPSPEPEEPCEGEGDGCNLVENPDFEEPFADGLPWGWKLDGSGKSKSIKQVMLPVNRGNYAVQLNGATYLYQDVAVEGGSCYRLQMFVNAPHAKIKWRYWCTWMEGSRPLSGFSKELHPESYSYQTDGWTDALQNRAFRAPVNATRLRMEIRTYTGTPESGEGLYVDGVSVERIR